MHLAVHGALNSIVPVYARYAYDEPQLIADPIAAAAHAAYEVLVSQYPDQQPRLGSELARWLMLAPHGELQRRGVELGRAAASAILTRRANDGWDVTGSYEFVNGSGEYQTTPHGMASWCSRDSGSPRRLCCASRANSAPRRHRRSEARDTCARSKRPSTHRQSGPDGGSNCVGGMVDAIC
jgi:hypothetical protein